MSIDIDYAVLARWNAAGLNTTIAKLYPGEEIPSPESATPAMPRANYFSTEDSLDSESKGTLVKVKRYTFEVWGIDRPTVGSWVKAIGNAFLNGEQSGKLQIPVATGRIMGTQEGSQGIEKHDDAVFRGFYELNVRWQRVKIVP